MKGYLTVCAGESIQHCELNPATPTRIGSAAGNELRLENPQIAPNFCQLKWETGAGTWVLSPLHPSAGERIRVNGMRLDGNHYLTNGDVIELPDVFLRFERDPEKPILNGAPVEEIPLRGHKQLTFGRSTGGAEEATKVVLDGADPSISRQHALLEQEVDGNYTLHDKSQDGTRLNGQLFQSRRLIIGDRFAIGGYTFEFTGYSIRRVARESGGKVEARHLSVALKSGKTILNDVSLDIDQCSFVGVLGGSGQGKSTLVNALCGINPATSGSVYLNGVRLDSPREMAAAGIGYVPQDDIVHVEITVEQALHYSGRLRLPAETPDHAIKSLVDETIERLGLTEHRAKRISQLSGGQRKRVSIATELLAKPSVLFLDEPSSGLDPATEVALMTLLRRLAAKDCTVICTTHVLGRAHLFDKVTFVHGGHVIFHGAPAWALEYFKVETLDEVYQKLAESGKTGLEWRGEFEACAGIVAPPDFGNLSAAKPAAKAKKVAQGGGYLRSLWVLLRRQWSILCADPLNLVFMVGQPLMIALMIGWVADDAVLRTFLCVVATLWFGCSNGAQQIVKELPVFRRERLCGLGINCYLQSKYLFLGAQTMAQALLMYLVMLTVAGFVHPMDVDVADFRARMADRLLPPAAAAQNADAQADELFEIVTADSPQPSNTAPEAAAATPEVDSVTLKMEEEARRANSWTVGIVTRVALFFEVTHNILDGTEQPANDQRESGMVGPLKLTSIFVNTIGLKLVALLATAGIGVAIGLAISALVQNGIQAVLWVPLVLIPQILFGGYVVTRPEMTPSVRFASSMIPSHASQRIMDVSNLFGQTTPRMTNRTKYPVFLTPGGDKETIEWNLGGEKTSERYDKVSEHNVSWQNLLVFTGHPGEHRHEFRMIQTSSKNIKVFEDSTERRDDVRYPMGIIFRYLRPAWEALGVLVLWAVGCYGVTFVGLLRKQTGK